MRRTAVGGIRRRNSTFTPALFPHKETKKKESAKRAAAGLEKPQAANNASEDVLLTEDETKNITTVTRLGTHAHFKTCTHITARF